MAWIALRMLTGDRKKYMVITFGVAFATMMMSHQMSVFWGIMRRTVNQILDVHADGIWVMDPQVQYVDEIRPLQETALDRVRSVPGVAWAVPLYKGTARAQTSEGCYRQAILLGVDDQTLFGGRGRCCGAAPPTCRPEGVIVDDAGYTYLWPGEEFRLGRVLEINDRRAVLVGICKASPPFLTMPIMYTRYHQAVRFALPERHGLSFVLVEGEPGVSPAELCGRIRAQDGPAGLERRPIRLEDDRVLFLLYRDSGQFRDRGVSRIRRRCRDRGSEFLSVYHGEPQTIRSAEGDGGHESRADRDDRDAGHGRRRPGVRPGDGVGRNPDRGDQPQYPASGGLLPPVDGHGPDRPGDRRHHGPFQPVEHQARPGARAGGDLPRIGGLSMAVADASVSWPPRAMPGSLASAVSCRGLTKEFPAGDGCVQALRGVDLRIPAGELALLVGPSGCGKTTLLSIIAGLLNPTAGQAVVLGTDLSALDGDAKVRFRRDQMGMVFQQYHLLPAFTAHGECRRAPHRRGRPEAQALSRGAALLESLGMGPRMQARPAQLSGGQQQRVAVARPWSMSRG